MATGIPRRKDNDRSKLFVAAYHGQCGECGADIEPGDEIGYAGGISAALCEGCWSWFEKP